MKPHNIINITLLIHINSPGPLLCECSYEHFPFSSKSSLAWCKGNLSLAIDLGKSGGVLELYTISFPFFQEMLNFHFDMNWTFHSCFKFHLWCGCLLNQSEWVRCRLSLGKWDNIIQEVSDSHFLIDSKVLKLLKLVFPWSFCPICFCLNWK